MAPKLQVALDVADMQTALRITEQVHGCVDYLEAGTPLIKSVGLDIVRELRKRYPAHRIVADMKSTDVGAYEAELAFNAGADFTVVSGVTTMATIREVIRVSDERARGCMVDLTGVDDLLSRCKSLASMGAKHVVLHRSIDEEITTAAEWSEPFCEAITSLNAQGLAVSVAGGLNLDALPSLCGYDVHAVIVGRAITRAPDPAAAAGKIADWIDENWCAERQVEMR